MKVHTFAHVLFRGETELVDLVITAGSGTIDVQPAPHKQRMLWHALSLFYMRGIKGDKHLKPINQGSCHDTLLSWCSFIHKKYIPNKAKDQVVWPMTYSPYGGSGGQEYEHAEQYVQYHIRQRDSSNIQYLMLELQILATHQIRYSWHCRGRNIIPFCQDCSTR